MPALAPPSPGPTSPSRTLLTAALADAPLRRALDASDNAVVMTNSSKCVVYINEGFTRLFGYQPAEVLGRHLSEVLLGPHSDPDLLESIRGNVLAKGSFRTDTLLYSKAGQPRWVSLVINASDESSGGPGGSISILTDITLTKMHEVLQTHVLEGMVNELPLPELMALVCREVERIAPEVTASILAVDAQGRLHPLAAPSLPATISRALDGLAIGPKVGSCGTAAFRNAPVVVTDMATDPLWADYQELFAPSGMRACWSSPIRDHRGQPIGTFAFYFREPRAPDALHQRLVDAVQSAQRVLHDIAQPLDIFGQTHISDALQRHGLRASDVLPEITESVMMDARPVTLQNIEAHGCPVMQGYLFGKPLPPDEIEAWLCAQAPRPYR
eukprot:gene3499-3544_t